jgi:hypothetical protein
MKTKDSPKIQTKKTNYMSDEAFTDLKQALEESVDFERGERRDLEVTRIRTLSKDTLWLGHHGLKAPADPWIPPAKNPDDTSSAGWQSTINRWSPTINVACTAMIGLSAYLVFMHPAHSITSSMFRLSISVLGLSGYALLAICKKKSETA